MRFSDGMQFKTSGALRAEKRRDGWYVVGKGMLCPVDDQAKALALIESLNRRQLQATL